MTKNLIPVIAKELGVEIGEEFEIKCNRSSKYRFKNDRLESKFFSDDDWQTSMFGLNQLGDIEIIKLAFEPQVNDVYWTYALDNFEPVSVVWLDYAIDYTRKLTGTVFRTREEAIAARPKKYRELTGKEWQE